MQNKRRFRLTRDEKREIGGFVIFILPIPIAGVSVWLAYLLLTYVNVTVY